MTQLDRLVTEMRENRPQAMRPRERAVTHGLAALFVLAATAGAVLLPWNRPLDPAVACALVALLTLAGRVPFEIGRGFATPDQLVTVALLYLLPLPLIPVLVVLANLLVDLRQFAVGTRHIDRWPIALIDGWWAIAAATTIALLGPNAHGTAAIAPFAAAALAQWLATCAVSAVRDKLSYGTPVRVTLRSLAWVLRIDTVLWPLGMMLAVSADRFPLALAAAVPFMWLLRVFAGERQQRYAAAVELNRAYRGTVMVLTDVVEAEDSYTAEHSRSVVSLVDAVADELGIADDARQELEFAALLHDVGKIAIPREILNKPAALTRDEFELIKTHTLHGQQILMRAGGLMASVGEIVRSCHERWDGDGYPDGLAGEEIPLAARIVFCCDAYNAMTTDRPYRRAMHRDDALAEIARGAGSQFDPRVATAVRAVARRGEDPAEAARDHALRALLARRPGVESEA